MGPYGVHKEEHQMQPNALTCNFMSSSQRHEYQTLLKLFPNTTKQYTNYSISSLIMHRTQTLALAKAKFCGCVPPNCSLIETLATMLG